MGYDGWLFMAEGILVERGRHFIIGLHVATVSA
jgi:uncharacterized alpha-E superfamily protein